MAFASNPFNFRTRDLPAHLAQSIDDGTQSDLLVTLKTDEAGLEATATQQSVACGQLVMNDYDSFILAAYPLLRDFALQTPSTIPRDTPVDTTDATLTDALTLFSLADGEAWHVEGYVLVRDAANPGFLAKFDIGGDFYRNGGTSAVLDPVKTTNRVGLTTSDANLVIATHDVKVQVQGEGVLALSWDVHITQARQYR